MSIPSRLDTNLEQRAKRIVCFLIIWLLSRDFLSIPKICRTWLVLTVDISCISCLIDINECDDTSLSSCPNRTECVNLQGNYTCECTPGYESTATGKTRGVDIQCEGEMISDLEGSGEQELMKHFEPFNPQTTGNSRKQSGNSLKRPLFFILWLLLVYFLVSNALAQ